MRLYIIRHGQTAWNKEKRLQGQKDIMLASEGIRLARLTGEGFRDVDINFAISSPLLRARQTAELVLAGREISIITDRRITEMSFGDWEGESLMDSQVLPADFIDNFYHDPMRCLRPPNGETFEDVLSRTGDFFRSLAGNESYRNANILISTHGAASRCLLANCLDDRDEIWRGCIPKNCSISIVEVTNGIGVLVEQDRIYYRI